MTKTLRFATLALVGALGTFNLAGCETGGSSSEQQTVGFAMSPSQKQVLAGETVTLTTTTQNTLGKQAEIQWNTTGGQIREIDNGRVAQVTFDQPGTYVVSAELMVDGQRWQTQTQTIQVRPVRTEIRPASKDPQLEAEKARLQSEQRELKMREQQMKVDDQQEKIQAETEEVRRQREATQQGTQRMQQEGREVTEETRIETRERTEVRDAQ